MRTHCEGLSTMNITLTMSQIEDLGELICGSRKARDLLREIFTNYTHAYVKEVLKPAFSASLAEQPVELP